MDWGVAAAKQQLSRVLKAARDEPQLIRTRGALVAAVLGPSEAEAYLAWRGEHARPSLGSLFEEGRRIAAEEGFDLTLPARVDRPNPLLMPLEKRTKPRGKARKGPPTKKKARARRAR